MVTALQFPPPTNWQDFETLARDLWRAIWCDKNTKKNGRTGQAQHGVDVYGRPDEGDKWAGVQCKGKGNYPCGELTEDELRAEIEKAKAFRPELSSWIMATTAKKDSKLEELARKITQQHLAAGLFSVDVWFWADIQEEIASYPDLARKHYSHSFFDRDALAEVQETTRELLRRVPVPRREEGGAISVEETTELTGIALSDANVVGEYHAEIAFANKQIENFKPKLAKEVLLSLRDRIWDSVDNEVKYSLLANLGFAHYKLGEFSGCSETFENALKIKPNTANANANFALAMQSTGKFSEAEKFARKAIKLDSANVNAHIVLLNLPRFQKIEKAQKIIPNSLRTDPGIAHNLGWIAFHSDKVEQAIEYFQKAVENDSTRHPEIVATLGQFLLPNEWDHGRGGLSHTSGNAERIQKGIALLTEALEKIKGTDMEIVHANWRLNRGVGKRFLDDFDGAAEDIDYALRLQPDRAEFIKHRALIEMMQARWASAVPLLEKIKENPETPEAILMLADALIFQKKEGDAIAELRHFLASGSPQPEKQPVANLFIRLCLEHDLTDEAQNILERFFPRGDNNIRALVNRARMKTKHQRLGESKKFLLRAKSRITPSTRPAEILDVAYELRNIREHALAAECLELLAEEGSPNEATRLSVESYYLAGHLTRTLEICQKVRAKHGTQPLFSEIEIAAYEEIGDYRAAIEICQAKLAADPADWYTDLRIAWFSYNILENDYPTEFLEKRVDFKKVPLDVAPKLARLYGVFGKPRLAIDLMYEVRRRYFENPNAHLCYAGVFFEYDGNEKEWLDTHLVQLGTAVEITDLGGKKEWYEIVEERDEDLKHNKISPSHGLGKLLIGKGIGDNVSIGLPNDPARRIERVTSIKSKYVFALHETMENYERMFPDSGSLRQIFIGNPENAEEFAEHSPKFFEIISKNEERREKIAGIYRDQNLTIGGFANLQGRSSFEAWQFLSHCPTLPARVSTGSIDEFSYAFDGLRDYPRLAADITSISLAYDLSLGDALTESFGKILIAQSTLTSILHQRNELSSRRGSGFNTVGKLGGEYYFQEFGADYVENGIARMDRIIEWCNSYCEISPYLSGLDIPRTEKESHRETILPEFYDTLQIAGGTGVFLLSEDLVLRRLASNEYKIRGGCMQAMLQFLARNRHISNKSYVDHALTLASRCLEFIQINVEVLNAAGKMYEWELTPQFILVLRKLGQKNCELLNMMQVAFDFLIDVCKRPIAESQKRRIIIAALVAIAANHDPITFLPPFVWLMQYHRIDFAAEVKFLIHVVDDWQLNRRIVPYTLP